MKKKNIQLILFNEIDDCSIKKYKLSRCKRKENARKLGVFCMLEKIVEKSLKKVKISVDKLRKTW